VHFSTIEVNPAPITQAGSSPMLRFWLVASANVLVASQAAIAQVKRAPVPVHGVAYDSVRGEPLRNAFVAIVGTTRSTHSDARGRFRFDSVPPGSYVVAVQHDALDSLGFAELSARATVGYGRDDVKISVPSFETLWHAVCRPGRPPKDSGFVHGTIRDASTRRPLGDAFVDLTWVELRVDKRRAVKRRQWRYATRADGDGRFAICGVPTAHWLRISAGSAGGASGFIDLAPTELRVRRRDLLIGLMSQSRAPSAGTVTGLVTDVGGVPLAGVRIVVDDTAEVRSGADGSFVMRNVPAGTRQLEILSVGTRAVVTAVDVLPNDTAAVALQLSRVTTLDVVHVMASRRRQALAAEIEARRRSGLGYTIEAGDIAKRTTFASVFNDLPSTRVDQRSTGFTVHVPDGRGGTCEPDVWIDGDLSVFAALSMIQPREVAAVELFPRAAAVPTRFRRESISRPSCGAILVWTNWGLGGQ
jgi:hypothetical protein